jgi:hypothetical protein
MTRHCTQNVAWRDVREVLKYMATARTEEREARERQATLSAAR